MSDCNELFEAILDRFFIICDNQCEECPVMKLRRGRFRRGDLPNLLLGNIGMAPS